MPAFRSPPSFILCLGLPAHFDSGLVQEAKSGDHSEPNSIMAGCQFARACVARPPADQSEATRIRRAGAVAPNPFYP